MPPRAAESGTDNEFKTCHGGTDSHSPSLAFSAADGTYEDVGNTGVQRSSLKSEERPSTLPPRIRSSNPLFTRQQSEGAFAGVETDARICACLKTQINPAYDQVDVAAPTYESADP